MPAVRRARSGTALALCLIWALFILYGTTIPFRFDRNQRFAIARLHQVTFNPFYTLKDGRLVGFPDIAQNLLLFFPLGALGAAAAGRPRGFARSLTVVAAGAALSTIVEGLQLFSFSRVASFADICWNTAGAALGVLWSDRLLESASEAVRRLNRLGALDSPAAFPLCLAVALACASAWTPFDVTLDVDSAFRKIRALHLDVWQADGPVNQLLEMIRFGVLTMLAMRLFRDMGVRTPTLAAVVAGAALALVLEASQVLITSRQPGLSDGSLNIAGAIAGALLLPAVEQVLSGQAKLFAFAAAMWVAAASTTLSHVGAPAYLPVWRLPAVSNANYAVVGHLFELLLMYLPLGYAVIWANGQRSLGAAVLVAEMHLFSLIVVERWAGIPFSALAEAITAALAAYAGGWLADENRSSVSGCGG